MMIAVSLPIVIFVAVLISATLTALNARGAGAPASAGVVLVVCLAVAVLQVFSARSIHFPHTFRIWIIFVLLPTAAVFGVSRLGWFRTHPWLLLVAGPLTFIIALVVAATLDAILFASRQSPRPGP